MDWNIWVWKQVYMFILTDFKKWWSDVSFLIPVSTIILILRKVKFETKHDQFLSRSTSCRLRMLTYFFWVIFSKKETAFSYFFLLFVPVRCFEKTFFLPNHLKFNLNSQNFLPFYNAEGKTLEWWCQSCVCLLIDHRQERKKTNKGTTK